LKGTTWAVSAILPIFSCAAFADGDIGPYVGGNIGLSSINTDKIIQAEVTFLQSIGYTNPTVTMDSEGFGFKLFGGYRFNQNFAAEAYYADLGTYTLVLNAPATTTLPAISGNVDSKIRAAGIDLLGMYPFSSLHTGFVRVGYFQENGEVSGTVNGSSSSLSGTSSNYKLGVGIESKELHQPNPRMRMEIEYYNNNTPIIMLSLSVLGHF